MKPVSVTTGNDRKVLRPRRHRPTIQRAAEKNPPWLVIAGRTKEKRSCLFRLDQGFIGPWSITLQLQDQIFRSEKGAIDTVYPDKQRCFALLSQFEMDRRPLFVYPYAYM